MTHTGVETTQKYREKVIEKGNVPVRVYTHTAYLHYSNSPPLVSISLCSVCKLCHFRIKEVNLTSIKVGWASSIFWECSNPACDASDNIIPKKATRNVFKTYQRWHPDAPACLGDYEFNSNVVLACQLLGGGARMASTFGRLMSLSRCSIWLVIFTDIEQEIGKAQIALG
jgi:hypothetical protein